MKSGDDASSESICRACLQPHGVKSLGDTVNTCELRTAVISEAFEAISSIKVAIDDGFPQKICSLCEHSLMKALNFKLTCEKSEQILRASNRESLPERQFPLEESIEPFKPIASMNENVNSEEVNKHSKFNEKGDVHEEHSDVSLPDKKIQIEESNYQIGIEPFQQHFFKNANKVDYVTSSTEETVEVCTRDTSKKLCCLICQSKFQNKCDMNEHLKMHTLDCSKCNMKFATFIDLRRHMKKHIEQRNSSRKDIVFSKYVLESRRTCEQCGKVFQYRASMLKHMKKHNSLPRSCIYCDFVPEHPSRIAQHMEDNHSHLKSISCNTCGKTFFKESNLRLHMAVHSGTKKHVCEMCGISFALACNLTAHRRLHTGERPYTCSHCGRGFAQQSALRSHEACHSDKRDHICADCGVAFSRPGALKNHRKRHSSTKAYVCTLCGKAFTFSSERKRHMMIHTGDKNHICDVCGSRFNRSTNLKVHRRIHTGETPYVCSLCGKGFIQSHCLKTHMNIHSPAGVQR